MTPTLALSVHSAPPDWYAALPRPKAFNASNSLTCRCGMVIGYTLDGVQYGVIRAESFGDWWKEMENCL